MIGAPARGLGALANGLKSLGGAAPAPEGPP